MRPNTNAQSQPNNRQKKPAEGSPEWQKGATKLLADMMSGANIEVSQTLNSPYFAALLRSLNPNFKMPTLEEIQAEQRAAGTKQSEMDEKMTFAEMMEGVGFHKCFWGTCPRSCPNFGRDVILVMRSLRGRTRKRWRRGKRGWLLLRKWMRWRMLSGISAFGVFVRRNVLIMVEMMICSDRQ